MARSRPLALSRRELLGRCGMGFGMIGLAGVLAADDGSGVTSTRSVPVLPVRLDPMAPRPPHFAAKAKQVVHLFMNGGPSHLDTFDPKPMLTKYHGKTLPGPTLRTERKTGAALGSPFQFKKYGESGIEVSELFARTAAEAHRRPVHHSFDVRRRAQPRAVAHADELRRRPIAAPEHGILDHLRTWAQKTRICPASSRCARAAIRSWRPRTGDRRFFRVPIKVRTSTPSTPRSRS